MDPLTPLATALSMLGDAALVIICPVMVWNTYRLVVLQADVNTHIVLDRERHKRIDDRLDHIESGHA